MTFKEARRIKKILGVKDYTQMQKIAKKLYSLKGETHDKQNIN